MTDIQRTYNGITTDLHLRGSPREKERNKIMNI